MAISQMQKLSLILSKDDLDSLLLALQAQANVQIYDLSENEEWQAAFEASKMATLRGDTSLPCYLSLCAWLDRDHSQ